VCCLETVVVSDPYVPRGSRSRFFRLCSAVALHSLLPFAELFVWGVLLRGKKLTAVLCSSPQAIQCASPRFRGPWQTRSKAPQSPRKSCRQERLYGSYPAAPSAAGASPSFPTKNRRSFCSAKVPLDTETLPARYREPLSAPQSFRLALEDRQAVHSHLSTRRNFSRSPRPANPPATRKNSTLLRLHRRGIGRAAKKALDISCAASISFTNNRRRSPANALFAPMRYRHSGPIWPAANWLEQRKYSTSRPITFRGQSEFHASAAR